MVNARELALRTEIMIPPFKPTTDEFSSLYNWSFLDLGTVSPLTVSDSSRGKRTAELGLSTTSRPNLVNLMPRVGILGSEALPINYQGANIIKR